MSEAGTVEASEDGGKVFEEDGLEVGVLLVGADYVWGCSVGVGVSRCAGTVDWVDGVLFWGGGG